MRIGLAIVPTTILIGWPFIELGDIFAPAVLPGFGGNNSATVIESRSMPKQFTMFGRRLAVSVKDAMLSVFLSGEEQPGLANAVR